MRQRLLDAALGRKPAKTTTTKSIEADVQELGGQKFSVKSETTPGQAYTVDLEIGLCDCTSGQTGKPCKHQVACANRYMINLPQVFMSTPENRQWLAGVALGKEQVPALKFFEELMPPTENAEVITTSRSLSQCENTDVLSRQDEENSSVVGISEERGPINTDEFTSQILSLLQKFKDQNTQGNLDHLTQKLKLIKSSNQLNSFLCCAASAVTGSFRGCGRGKIPCQPTSIGRRQPGVPRGAAPLAKGRKRERNVGNNKRPRNLAYNISLNRPNAKTH